jgi:hypothetical protein
VKAVLGFADKLSPPTQEAAPSWTQGVCGGAAPW